MADTPDGTSNLSVSDATSLLMTPPPEVETVEDEAQQEPEIVEDDEVQDSIEEDDAEAEEAEAEDDDIEDVIDDEEVEDSEDEQPEPQRGPHGQAGESPSDRSDPRAPSKVSLSRALAGFWLAVFLPE